MFVFKLHYNIVNKYKTNQKNDKIFPKEESDSWMLRWKLEVMFVICSYTIIKQHFPKSFYLFFGK
jgi:hypothetical protein